MPNQPLRVATLVRVSTTHLEQADSPQHQLAFMREEMARAGWTETGLVYQAELTGAVILDRPEIRRMLRDASEGQFDAILLKSISRLGRDTLGLLMVKRMLDDLQVELIALADGYRSRRDPELIFLVHAERAQAGRQEIAKNVRAGIVQAARRGIWPAGTLPFGLRKLSRFEVGPDPETAPIVQLIFALRQEQRGLVAIARHLNQELRVKAPAWWHLRTQIQRLESADAQRRDGRVQARLQALRARLLTGAFRWQPRTIRLILTNTAYRGELRYNRTTGERRMHGRLVRRRRGEGEWVRIPCTPLVSGEEWARAQLAARERAQVPRRSLGSPFLLSGLIWCGQCGSPMRAIAVRPGAGRRGGERRGYYACRASVESGAHPGEYIRATDLEAGVLEALRADLAGIPDPVLPVPRLPRRSERAAEAAALEAELRDLAEARFFRREELRRGRLDLSEFEFEAGIIRDREAAVRRQLEALRQDREAVSGDADRTAAECAARLKRLEGESAQLKAVLRILLRRVTVYPGGQVEVQTAYTAAEAGTYPHSDTTPRPTTP